MAAVAVLLHSGAACAEKEYWDVPTRDHLEVSLMSLRERAAKIQQRNQWLKVEMHKMQNFMSEMERDLADVQRFKSSFGASAEEYDEKVRNLSLVEKRVLRANMTVGQLQSEYRRLLTQLEVKKEQEAVLQEKIAATALEIEDWKERVQTEQVQLTGVTPEISRYQVLLEESKRSLDRAKQELTRVKNKHERPNQEIFRLKRDEKQLSDELSLLKDELSVYEEEENILKKQMEDIARDRERDVEQLAAQIQALSERKNELDSVLVRAEQKIKLKHVELNPSGEDVGRLAENLDVIRDENLALKEEMTSLEKSLQKISVTK